jgi:hypothetical protein
MRIGPTIANIFFINRASGKKFPVRHSIHQHLPLSYRLLPFNPWIIPKISLPPLVEGHEKRRSETPEKPVKRQDPIRPVMGDKTAKGVHFNLFRSCMSFRSITSMRQ